MLVLLQDGATSLMRARKQKDPAGPDREQGDADTYVKKAIDGRHFWESLY